MSRVGWLCAAATGVLLMLGVPGVGAVERFVQWVNPANVTVSGDRLEKTSGCQGCEDAGAVSRQMIRSGDGYVEFTVGETNTFWLAGLGHQDTSTRYDDIEFAFRFNGAGRADVMENGAYKGGDTPYAVGDVFRVAVTGGRVQYARNGRVLLESQRAPVYPLMLDTALGTLGASIENARIETNPRGFTEFEDDEFTRLDANDDGVVTPDEWRGSLRVFRRRDFNADGVLTRRELLLDDESAFGEEGGLATADIFVSARERWTDTGLTIRPGDTVTIAGDGLIQLSADRRNTADPTGSGRHALDAPLRQSPAGGLIARIGNDAPIFIGDLRVIRRSPVGGRLYLGVNDDHLADNSGQYRVTVTIE
jgi:hypothetical protein